MVVVVVEEEEKEKEEEEAGFVDMTSANISDSRSLGAEGGGGVRERDEKPDQFKLRMDRS